MTRLQLSLLRCSEFACIILPMQKSSSEVMNWDEVDYERFPKLRNVTGAMEVILSPNEALYIPPLWFHAVQGIGAGNMSVNVFWRSLDKADCDPKDLYGNKDPPAAAQASMLAAQVRRSSPWSPCRLFFLSAISQQITSQDGCQIVVWM